MKNIFAASVSISAALLSVLLSGCSGQIVDQTQGSAVMEMTTDSVTSTTTTTMPAVTTPPQITSGTTCTTIGANESIVENRLSSMTLKEKIYQLFIVTPEELTHFSGSVTEAGNMTKSAVETRPVGGVIYFSQNIESWQQTYQMLYNTQQYAQEANNGVGMFTAIDEEGGSVARIADKLGLYSSYDMEYYGKKEAYEEIYNLGNTIGTCMKDLGFNVNFAPVADVNINSNNELGSRIFSDDPQIVSEMAAQFVMGVEDTGVSATLKHFPGLGAGEGNTHDDSVLINRSYFELKENEFEAFEGGIKAGVDFVMVGHQMVSATLDNLPADLSPAAVNWLKLDNGFNGLIITDSHSMGAITRNYTPGEAAVLALQAGVDIILMPYDLENAVDGILSAVKNGDITEERINESVRKILSKKYNLGLIALKDSETTAATAVTLEQWS